jgi:hypothetical protein
MGKREHKLHENLLVNYVFFWFVAIWREFFEWLSVP